VFSLKTHKWNTKLTPILSCICSVPYIRSRFFHKILILLVAFRLLAWTRILLFDIKSRPASRPTSFLFEWVGALSQALKQARTKHSTASTVEVRNVWISYLHCIMIYLHHSLQLLKPVSFQILDAVFSSYVSLFTNATVDKVLQDTWGNLLKGRQSRLAGGSWQGVAGSLYENYPLLCGWIISSNRKVTWLWNTPLPSVVSNIFMQHSEKLALDRANHKSSLYLQYVHN